MRLRLGALLIVSAMFGSDAEAGKLGGKKGAKCFGVSFDGGCVSKLNVESTIDFDSEGADYIDAGFCYDETGAKVSGCIWVAVDENVEGMERVQYWLDEADCTYSVFSPKQCFAGKKVLLRAIHDISAYTDDMQFSVTTSTQYQEPTVDTVYADGTISKIATWEDVYRVESFTWNYWDDCSPSGLETMTVTLADGTSDTVENELYNICPSYGDDYDYCDSIGGKFVGYGLDYAEWVTDATGDVFPEANVSFMPEGMGVSVTVSIDAFGDLLSTLYGALGDAYAAACHDDVDEEDFDATLDVAGFADPWVYEDIDASDDCVASGYSTMETKEWETDDGQHCEGHVRVDHDCGSDGLGGCGCVESFTPDGSEVCVDK